MRSIAAVALSLLLVAGAASAATFVAPTDRELFERAEAIVVGTVISSAGREGAGRMVFTDYQVEVEQVIKGRVLSTIMTVSEVGGYANGHGVAVAGAATYTPGSRVVAFLRQRDDGSFFTAYMALGKYRFVKSQGVELLVRDSDGLEVDSPDAFAARPAQEFIDHMRAGAPDSATRPGLIQTQGRPEFEPAPEALASAYVLTGNGKPLRWDCPGPGTCTKSWSVGTPQSGTVNSAEGVQDAMAAWTDDPDSWIRLTDSGLNNQTGPDNDDVNDIIFNSSATVDNQGNGGFCDSGAGCAFIYFNDAPDQHTFDGVLFNDIVSADVLVRPGSFSQNLFEAIIAHELGHAIGLRHSNQGTPSSSSALMNSTVSGSATLRAWDREAIAEVYGNGLPCQSPSITSITSSATVTSGSTKTLTVSATGTTPFTFQWYDGTSGDTSTPVGTNSNSFTTPPITTTRNYWVRVTNECNSANSTTVTLTPCNVPTITTQPASQSVISGNTATLDVEANGAGLTLSYKWYEGTAGNTSNQVSTSKTFTTPVLTATKQYWVRVSTSCGSKDSNTATITVTQTCVPAAVSVQPVSQTIAPGNTATLTVETTGTAPISYQWYEGAAGNTSTPVSTSQTFTTPALSSTKQYWVRVSNSCGTKDSSTATITVTQACTPVAMGGHPTTAQTSVGNGALIFVNVTGTEPVAFQWYQGESPDTSAPISGATSSTFNAGPFNAAGTFKFWARATNSCGAANSATIVVTVSCGNLEVPVISAPPASPFSNGYFVSWTGNSALSSFELQEATNADFTANLLTFPVSGSLSKSIDPHPSIASDVRYHYRVRAINTCSGVPTAYSPSTSTLVTAPQPQNSSEFSVSVPENVSQGFTQNYLVPGFGETATALDTFSITIDNACSNPPPQPCEPWLTVFPDSGALSAGGTTVQLTFNTGGLDVGTNTATITVNRFNGPSSLGIQTSATTPPFNIPFSVSVVTPVSPVPRSTPAPPGTLIIPAIAHADGIGTRFQSDVRIANTGDTPITYELSFTPSGQNGTSVGKKTTLTIEAKDSKGLDDIVKAWYGSGVLGESGIGTLEIRPLNGANPLSTFASSRTYAISSQGTLGQFIPAIPLDKFIGTVADNPAARLSLQQIANSSSFRTNFGFVEGAGVTTSLVAKLLDGNNNVLQQATRTIAPYGHLQEGFNSLFAGNTQVTDGRVEVSVSSGGKISAYASVLDNTTTDPLCVFPVQPSTVTSSHYVAPGIAELNNGANNFHSDMRIFNGGSAPVTVALKYYPQGSSTPNPLTISKTIAAGAVNAIDNVLPTLWGLTASGGAVTVDAPANSSLVVTARTFSRNLTNNGTYGQFIPGVTAADAVGSGERALQLLQLEETEEYRTNLGLVEVTGSGGVEVEVTATRPDTKLSVSTVVGLGANEFRQLGLIFKQLGMSNVYQGRISVRVLSGAGRVAAYGSVVDNRTVDPTYVPAQ